VDDVADVDDVMVMWMMCDVDDVLVMWMMCWWCG